LFDIPPSWMNGSISVDHRNASNPLTIEVA
jgi:hypothetical protein